MRRVLRRRNIFLDSFQGRLVALNFLYFGILLITFAGALFLPVVMELSDEATSWQQKQQASTQFLTLHQRLWPAILLLFGLLAVHSVVITHRIAGPLHQFRRLFRSIASGDLSVRAAIRKNDYLTKEAVDINDMIAALRRQIDQCSEASEKALAALAAMREAASSGNLSEVQRLSGHVEVHLSRLDDGIGFFTTTGAEEDDATAKEAALQDHNLCVTRES